MEIIIVNEQEITNYYLINVETGKHFEGFDKDDQLVGAFKV